MKHVSKENYTFHTQFFFLHIQNKIKLIIILKTYYLFFSDKVIYYTQNILTIKGVHV